MSGCPAVSFIVATEAMMGLVKRSRLTGHGPEVTAAVSPPVAADSQSAALTALRATLAAGNPPSGRQLETRFGLTRAEATKVRELAVSEQNGHASQAAALHLGR